MFTKKLRLESGQAALWELESLFPKHWSEEKLQTGREIQPLGYPEMHPGIFGGELVMQ